MDKPETWVSEGEGEPEEEALEAEGQAGEGRRAERESPAFEGCSALWPQVDWNARSGVGSPVGL